MIILATNLRSLPSLLAVVLVQAVVHAGEPVRLIAHRGGVVNESIIENNRAAGPSGELLVRRLENGKASVRPTAAGIGVAPATLHTSLTNRSKRPMSNKLAGLMSHGRRRYAGSTFTTSVLSASRNRRKSPNTSTLSCS